jgi:transposase
MAVQSKISRRELTPAERSYLWALHCEGYTPTQIWRKTKVPRTTVTSLIKRQSLSNNNTFESKPRSGPKKKLSVRAERRLVRTAVAQPRMPLKALATPSKSGKRLNHHTVAIILKSFGKAKRRPRKKPFLTDEHRLRRRIHCRAERDMERDNRKVCWSDEVTFEVGEDLRTFYVTRAAGREDEYATKNLRPTFKSGRKSVGVWSCFCGDEMGPLYMLPEGETMTAKRYKYVLQRLFIPFYERMRAKHGEEVVMQEDNASWHRAGIVERYLTNKKVNRIKWPAQSPDLNPIENLWKYIKDLISATRHRIKNPTEMREALKEIWPKISGEFLLRLCDSVPNRWRDCLKNKGGATKY